MNCQAFCAVRVPWTEPPGNPPPEPSDGGYSGVHFRNKTGTFGFVLLYVDNRRWHGALAASERIGSADIADGVERRRWQEA